MKERILGLVSQLSESEQERLLEYIKSEYVVDEKESTPYGTLYIGVNSISDKEKFSNLIAHYDPTDPDHTKGSSDYFIELLEEYQAMAETDEESEQLQKEIDYISKYEEVIIGE